MILPIDLGYGWVKAQLDDKIIQFPHALGTPDPTRFTLSASTHPLTVEREGEAHSYFIGQAAISQSRHTWTHVARKRNPWELRALLAECARLLAPDADLDISFLVSGLPVAWYAEDQKEHVAALKGSLTYRYGTAQHTVNVSQVSVIPQPVGTILSLPSSSLRCGVIDIGHFTTDFAVVEGTDYLAPRSFSIPTGMSQLHADLRDIVRQAYRRDLSAQEADQVLREGCVRIAGESKDIPVAAAVDALSQQIIAEATSRWGEALDLDKIVVTGGGAHVLFSRIEAVYAHAVTVDEPELANLRGYGVYGERLR